jgi:hypothetical protein
MNKKKIDTFQYIHPDTVLIDNISLTYSPKNNSDKEHILKAVGNEGWLSTWAKPKFKKDGQVKYLFSTGHYHSAVDLIFPDDTFTHNNSVRLEMNPKVNSTGFLRLDYNPEKISLEALTTCLNAIMPQGGINPVFDHGNVTRLDIAVDIKQVFPLQLILDYKKMQFRMVYIESGVPTSIYIGKDTGVTQMYVYDKAKEMTDKGYQVKPMSDYQIPSDGLTRIEIRHRPKKTKFADLFNLPNLFSPMYVIGTPLKVKGDLDFNIKRDLCVLNGLRHGVKHFSPTDRWAFGDKLEEVGKADFLDIQMLWSSLPDALLKVYPHAKGA